MDYKMKLLLEELKSDEDFVTLDDLELMDVLEYLDDLPADFFELDDKE